MSAMRKIGSVVAMSALAGALGLVCAQAANTNNPSYQSSITVGDAGDGEDGEAARYMEFAKIDAGRQWQRRRRASPAECSAPRWIMRTETLFTAL
jgi:hypothetical protein